VLLLAFFAGLGLTRDVALYSAALRLFLRSGLLSESASPDILCGFRAGERERGGYSVARGHTPSDARVFAVLTLNPTGVPPIQYYVLSTWYSWSPAVAVLRVCAVAVLHYEL